MPGAETLVEKILALAPEQVSQVEDFVDFLIAKARRKAALRDLLAMAPSLKGAGVRPMSEREVQAEVDAVRSAARPNVADCS